ncbi:unnamed protein product (macronuclear) [Paramecium tetraurelia]|uniref:Condensin complex subunit 1 C-terminal domain-containing protein n=1 Tax=Paramecium tetraurelia TaxID=5888 RepID=A0DXP7_PARTE|nr:uncharacterized protein GSPATT00021438001 [Paramecium tetraurelia]CAK87814.1 unnamed protein product [Paramecium tetraurelia]|eukprot:XP_001455211.1 hypothetical protein (macronuclear) [Paramecium tetraurelia strain d4-2]
MHSLFSMYYFALNKKQIAQEEYTIYPLLQNQFIHLLQHPDTQHLAFTLISQLFNKNCDLSTLKTQVIESLLALIRWDFTLKNPQQGFESTSTLLNAPFPDLHNLIRIVEPTSLIKYYFINKQGIDINGLLQTMELFLTNRNFIFDHAVEFIEITQRVARHQNEQVRSYALKFIHRLADLQDNQTFRELIHATLLAGLMDESLEIRVQALNELKILIPKEKDQLLILLYKNSHCDDLRKVSESVAQQLFPHFSGNIQTELMNIINEKRLNECVILCCYSTISRNWRIRRSGLKTLQSIVQYYPNQELPIEEILKVSQNCSLFESHFDVRYNGFLLMYHIVRMYENKITQFTDQIIQNCLFHFSDDHIECQELCTQILIILIDRQSLIQELYKQQRLIVNNDLALEDLKVKIMKIEEVQKQYECQVPQEDIHDEQIRKYQSRIMLGIIACFVQMIKLRFDQSSVEQVSLMICQGLQIVNSYRDMMYKYLISGLKKVYMQQKELVKQMINQLNLTEMLRSDGDVELIGVIEDIVGTSILQE